MNHLAHALLAGDDEDLRLGGMLGDFVHGTLDDSPLPPRVVEGIRLHRAIDVYTDAHAEVRAARERFEPPFRRYAGILLDMVFDHYLALDFGTWSAVPLAVFSAGLRASLHRHDALLPPALRRFRDYMDEHDLPAGYARGEEIDRALRGIGRRLRHDNPLGAAWPLLQQHGPALRGHFRRFFPELRDWAAAQAG